MPKHELLEKCRTFELFYHSRCAHFGDMAQCVGFSHMSSTISVHTSPACVIHEARGPARRSKTIYENMARVVGRLPVTSRLWLYKWFGRCDFVNFFFFQCVADFHVHHKRCAHFAVLVYCATHEKLREGEDEELTIVWYFDGTKA